MRIKPSPPAYQKLKELICQEIANGRLKIGSYLPAERVLCEIIKASRSPVRKAIDDLEKEGFITRTKENGRPVVGPSAFKVNNRSQSPTTVSRNLIAIVSRVPMITESYGERSSFFSNTLFHASKSMENSGFDILYINPAVLSADPPDVISRIPVNNCAGVIYFSGTGEVSAPYLEWLKEPQCPVVVIEGCLKDEDIPVDSVDIDNTHGAYIATEHLIKNGHTKLVHFTFTNNTVWKNDRINGFRKCLATQKKFKAKVIEACDVIDIRSPDDWRRIEKPANDLFNSGATAVFAANDLLASCLIRAANKRGISIPEQLSIIGFDNLKTNIDVPLSTVSHMTRQLGEKAGEILKIKISNKTDKNIRRELVKPVLVIRASVSNLNKD
mgnify:CR=1 FL=1